MRRPDRLVEQFVVHLCATLELGALFAADSGHHARLPEDLQVIAHGGLSEVEVLRDLADCHRSRGKVVGYGEAGGVGDGLEAPREETRDT